MASLKYTVEKNYRTVTKVCVIYYSIL